MSNRCTTGGHFTEESLVLDNHTGTSVCRTCAVRLKIPHIFKGEYFNFEKQDALGERPGKTNRGVHLRGPRA